MQTDNVAASNPPATLGQRTGSRRIFNVGLQHMYYILHTYTYIVYYIGEYKYEEKRTQNCTLIRNM